MGPGSRFPRILTYTYEKCPPNHIFALVPLASVSNKLWAAIWMIQHPLISLLFLPIILRFFAFPRPTVHVFDSGLYVLSFTWPIAYVSVLIYLLFVDYRDVSTELPILALAQTFALRSTNYFVDVTSTNGIPLLLGAVGSVWARLGIFPFGSVTDTLLRQVCIFDRSHAQFGCLRPFSTTLIRTSSVWLVAVMSSRIR